MKKMISRLAIVCLVLVSVGFVFTCVSSARPNRGSLVMIWLFDEGEGEVAQDSSGNRHDGEIKGDVKWVEGLFGEAVSFPGVGGSSVRTPYEESLNLETWSMTMWAKLQDIGGAWQYIFTKEGPQDTRGFYLVTDGIGSIFTGFTKRLQWAEVTSKTELYDDKWHHLATTYDKETLRLYVDGNVEAQRSFTETPFANEADVVLGERFNSSDPTKGVIDEIGLFSVGLTEAEVNEVMNDGLDDALGLNAVSSSGKLAVTWGSIRGSK